MEVIRAVAEQVFAGQAGLGEIAHRKPSPTGDDLRMPESAIWMSVQG
jgi:hypothetical protein